MDTLARTLLLDAALAHWNDLRGDRPMPRRAELSPLKLRALLPHIVLLDLVEGGPLLDFRYRLVGEHVNRFFGASLTGRLHSQLRPTPEIPQPNFSRFMDCVREKAPQRWETMSRNANGVRTHLRVLVCPLSDDGSTVDGLFAAVAFDG